MVSRVSKLLLAGVAATALAGASMTGAALAHGPGGGGGGHGMGGGGMGHSMGGGGGTGGGSFASHGGPGGAPSFGGRATVGAAPSAHANMIGPGGPNGGRTFSRSVQGRTFNGNDRFARTWSGDRWHRDHGRDRRHFRGAFFGFGFGPSYDDSYYDDYAYNDCSYYNRWDWRWRRYCGPYAYGYGPYGYDSGW